MFINDTKELLGYLQRDYDSEKREESIKYIEELLEKRQVFLDSSPILSDLDSGFTQDLLNLELQVKEAMIQYQNQIKKDLQIIQTKKRKNKQYTDPYSTYTRDGIYLDKKK
jgi:hypothetical protein